MNPKYGDDEDIMAVVWKEFSIFKVIIIESLKVLVRVSAKGTMVYISVSRGRLRCALQSNLPLVSLDNLEGLHFNFFGKNIERKKHATSRECS